VDDKSKNRESKEKKERVKKTKALMQKKRILETKDL
jgi:hypothetical protein